MNRIITATTAFALIAGSAASAFARERPEFIPADSSVVTAPVEAGSLLNAKDLSRRGLAASDVISVTRFPSTGIVDAPSREG